MTYIILGIIFAVIAIACFVIGYLQFNEKGKMLNNAYLYASDKERETMDKKAYYRQSGIAFALIGIIFSVNALEMILKTGKLFYLVILILVITVIYAVVSTYKIEKNKK